MRYIFYTIFALLLSIQFSSCSTMKGGQKGKPTWVSQHPSDPSYYSGVGMANMLHHPNEYIQVAQKNALSDLTSSIAVKISSNSIFRQMENNQQLIEAFESDIRISMQEDLEGFELVDSWSDPNTKKYWVYYRLSKEKYAQIKQEKLVKAKRLGKQYYENALQKTQEGDVKNALILFGKAVEAIQHHLDEDLNVFTSEGPVELVSAIHTGIQQLYNNIDLFTPRPHLSIPLIAETSTELKLTANYKGNRKKQPQANIPIRFRFTKGGGNITELVNTDAKGKAKARIDHLTSKEKQQEVVAELDINFLIDESVEGHKLHRYFFAGKNLPQLQFHIEVERLNAFLVFDEKIFDEKAQRGLLENNFKKELSKSLYNFTKNKNNANIQLKVRTNTTKGDIEKHQHYTAYIVYLDFFLSVETMDGVEIFNDGFEDVKGMRADSYDHAIRDAYQKMINQVNRDIVPKLGKLSY